MSDPTGGLGKPDPTARAWPGLLPDPHPDIEHGVARRPIEYLVTLPDRGVGPGTGVVLVIDGHGMTPDLPYNTILRRYLASKYDCVAVGVFYFGCKLKSLRFGRIVPGPDFFVNLARDHGVQVQASRDLDLDVLVQQLCRILAERGIRRLEPSCWFSRTCDGEYDSFGLLPAIDHLQVLGALLRRWPLDRRRLFVLGSSMGGYIAEMMVKLAPHTFRMVVDNSGLVRSPDLRRAKRAFRRGSLYGIEIVAVEDSPWEADPASPHACLDHHLRIRDLLTPGHFRPTATVRRLYHAGADTVVPVADRVAFAEQAARFGPVSLEVIDRSRVDGVLFKSLEHGMAASLRHLFDDAWRALDRPGGDDAAGPDDFLRESRHSLDCGSHEYRVGFSRTGEIRVTLQAVAPPVTRPAGAAGGGTGYCG